MALRKGFCSHCKGDEMSRIFDVNKEAEVCYCPHCMAEMAPIEAIQNYRGLISHHLRKASKALFESTQYLLAYQTFAHIIDIDETIRVARFGRILAMVHLSTLRKSKIAFAHSLHRQEANKLYHYQETANEYFHFLILLLDALDEYESRLKKRITTHGIFYDLDCVITYLQRIDEIKKYKSFISLEATYFIECNKTQFNDVIKKIYQNAPLYENALKKDYVTADGFTYVFNKYDNNGYPLVSVKTGRPELALKHKHLTLYPTKENKRFAIRDDIYQNNLTLSRLVTLSIPLAIIFFASALAGVIAFILVPSYVVKGLVLTGTIALVISSIVLFILHFAWKNRLRKKYYNGTNPFIFK